MVADSECLEQQRPRRLLESSQGRDFRGSFSGHERDHLFWNADGESERLFDAAFVHGVDLVDDGRSAVAVDVDGDGDLDLAVMSLQGLHLLENLTPPRSFLRVRLQATRSEPLALGALVRVTAAGVTQSEIVELTEGLQSQVCLDQRFGLAAASRVQSLEVEWPSGARQRWDDLPVNRRVLVVEGQKELTIRALPAWPKSSKPPAHQPTSIALRTVPLEDANAAPRALAPPGKPVLVNFFAASCQPCRHELPELVRLAAAQGERLALAGVKVDATQGEAARQMLADAQVQYPCFRADQALLEHFFGREGSLALPSTFVFDASGRLRRVYRRAVEANELLLLLASFEDEDSFARDELRLAVDLRESGHYFEALQSFRDLRKRHADWADVHDHLGRLYALLGEHASAEQAFEEAVALEPDNGRTQFNLGIARLNGGRPAKALEPLEAARRLRGEDLTVLLALGSADEA